MGDRVQFDRKTLDLIFSQLDLSLEELSGRTGSKPRAIKNWRTGNCTMPLSFFHKLCAIEPEIENFLKEGKGLDRNWGSVLGGTNVIKGLTKQEMKKRMQKARSHITSKFPDTETIDLSNPEALEFYGAVMGDGCVSRYLIGPGNRHRTEVRITGNAMKDREYLNGILAPMLNRLFKTNVNVRKRRGANVVDLVSCASHVSSWLIKQGFPIGKKGKGLQIPQSIMSLPNEKINHLIRGLLDTDGCVAARKDEGYKYPYIFIWTISGKLRKQIKMILREQGIPAYIHGDTVVVRGCNNFKKWFKKIGSSNPRNLNKYHEWLLTGQIKPTGL